MQLAADPARRRELSQHQAIYCETAGKRSRIFSGLFLYAAAGLLLCLNTLPRPALLGGPPLTDSVSKPN
jgi:hypothetical protein